MSKNEEFEMIRLEVPDTAILQASIIAEADRLPQQFEFVTDYPRSSRRWRQTMRITLPFASLCLIALVLLINPSSDREMSNTLATSGDLDWQQIMQLEDEWLFTEL